MCDVCARKKEDQARRPKFLNTTKRGGPKTCSHSWVLSRPLSLSFSLGGRGLHDLLPCLLVSRESKRCVTTLTSIRRLDPRKHENEMAGAFDCLWVAYTRCRKTPGALSLYFSPPRATVEYITTRAGCRCSCSRAREKASVKKDTLGRSRKTRQKRTASGRKARSSRSLVFQRTADVSSHVIGPYTRQNLFSPFFPRLFFSFGAPLADLQRERESESGQARGLFAEKGARHVRVSCLRCATAVG